MYLIRKENLACVFDGVHIHVGTDIHTVVRAGWLKPFFNVSTSL